jgi:hypothetical protein
MHLYQQSPGSLGWQARIPAMVSTHAGLPPSAELSHAESEASLVNKLLRDAAQLDWCPPANVNLARHSLSCRFPFNFRAARTRDI